MRARDLIRRMARAQTGAHSVCLEVYRNRGAFLPADIAA